jgi:hypothetical protein
MDILLKNSEEKGKAIYAARKFNLGEKVLTFQGKIINERGIHTLQIGIFENLLVDEPWRYVNHSCNPNCGIKDKTTLVAMKKIEENEEITFDYAMTEQKLQNPFQCLCGSDNCRGKIGGFKDLPEKLKEKYKGYISDYLIK